MKTATQLRATARRRIRGIPPEQAQEILNDIAAIAKVKQSATSTLTRIVTRCMTGGYWSQHLDGIVMFELGKHAYGRK